MRSRIWLVFLIGMVGFTAGCEEEQASERTTPKVETQERKPISQPEQADKQVEAKPFDIIPKLFGAKPKMVELETTQGTIIIELNDKAAPVSVKNFLRYVKEGSYDGMIFHRVIKGFMIQGGGFSEDMGRKPTHEPIVNEASNGLKNDRGTIAMARTNNPNSATSQFFINLVDNNFLNFVGPSNPGYTVFGKVVEGMDVVDKIGAVKTGVRRGMRDVPTEPVVIKSAKVAK